MNKPKPQQLNTTRHCSGSANPRNLRSIKTLLPLPYVISGSPWVPKFQYLGARCENGTCLSLLLRSVAHVDAQGDENVVPTHARDMPTMTVYHRRDTLISGELLVMRERTLFLKSNNTEAT